MLKSVVFGVCVFIGLLVTSYASYTLGKFEGTDSYHKACAGGMTIIVDEKSPHTVVVCQGAGTMSDEDYALVYSNTK